MMGGLVIADRGRFATKPPQTGLFRGPMPIFPDWTNPITPLATKVVSLRGIVDERILALQIPYATIARITQTTSLVK